MHNLFKKTVFILLWTIFSASGMDVAAPISKKMGLELELQGVVYQKPDTIALQDHVRLFESNKKFTGTEKPLWYLEVDGAGNLEFVTESFILNGGCEAEIFSIINEMRQLLRWCLDHTVPSPEGFFSFKVEQGALNVDLMGVGKWVHKSPVGEPLPYDIEVNVQNPTWRIRPQITFQLPLDLIPAFILHMAYDHSSLTTILNELIRHGFLPLAIFEKEFSSGEGLAALTILYAEILSNHHDPEELGPKGILTLMSRVSFSSMYASLDTSEKEVFSVILDKYLAANGGKKLFKAPYSLFYGEDLGQHPEIKSRIMGLTIKNFIQSIINPTHFGGLFDEFKAKFYEILTTLRGHPDTNVDAKAIIEEELENLSKGLFNFRGNDLVSPPPFLRHTYSMGKYNTPHAASAVLEVRGYSSKYKKQMRMDETVFEWLHEEIESALVDWSPSKNIKRMIKGNIEGCISAIEQIIKTPPASIVDVKKKLSLPTTRTYYNDIARFIESLTEIGQLQDLKTLLIELLKKMES